MNKQKLDEEQKRKVEVRRKIQEAAEAAIKEAIPHPEFSRIWANASATVYEDGNINAAVQRAQNMDMEIQQKILSPEELFYEAQQSRIRGIDPQRIISPERKDLQEKLHTQFTEDFLDERVGYITYPAAETASFRARNYEEAVLIFRIIVLQARIADKPTDALKQEFATAVQELEAVREGLPKYVSPPPRDWNKFSAISKLLSFYVLNPEAKRALRKKLESFSIEQIQKKTAVFEAKNSEAAAAAAAAQSKKGIVGGLFGRTRKGRKGRKGRKTRKN
jgi:hypothetical protein